MMNDSELINAIKNGEEQAFRRLVDDYQLLVVNTCKGLVHSIEDAQDIAQEVFIEVYHSVEKFRGDSKLSTWLYRIAVNKSLNFIRDNKRRNLFQSISGNLFGTKELDLPTNDTGYRPDKEAENNQRRKNIFKAIDDLPENQRVAFTLSKIEDLSYREIAEVMSLSVSSVESLIHRAKLNLQKKLYKCYKKGI
ncbi:RNA polymerase sigma factor [Sunxiuqinia sp. A32]|uniref:RNA polymerase sigma factor n=1 Tax=Sunxiuqinia sp. A32 TaxID=3461496 RepID=UPI0040462320